MAVPRKKTNRPKEIIRRIVDLPKHRGEDYVSFYSNHVEIAQTPWDLRMVFYEITEDGKGELILEEKGRASMSAQHAKALLGAFTTQVEKWEERYGEIKVPSNEAESNGKNRPKTVH